MSVWTILNTVWLPFWRLYYRARGLRLAHCWEPRPEEREAPSATCFEWDHHLGPHRWVEDSDIRVSFNGEATP